MLSKRIVTVIAIGVVAGAGALYYYQFASRAPETPGDIVTGPVASLVPATGLSIESLPPTALGGPSTDPATADVGGTSAKGRVDRIYVRLQEGVLIDLAHAQTGQRDGWRFASVEFPDPLANGTTVARALVPRSSADEVAVGDVVEMKFAPKDVKGPYVQSGFVVKERDRITSVVAKSGSALAQEYQRRIAARTAPGPGTQLAGSDLWKMLPLERAVKIVRGTGKREVAVFTDPYCPACGDMEKVLGTVDDVTLYVFMFPAIRPERANDSRRVWCSPDRAKAWTELVAQKKIPEAEPTCDNPVDAILALRQPIGIQATPTLVYEDGKRSRGTMLPVELRYYLSRAESESVRRAK